MKLKQAVLFLKKKNQKDFFEFAPQAPRHTVMPAKADIHVFLLP